MPFCLDEPFRYCGRLLTVHRQAGNVAFCRDALVTWKTWIPWPFEVYHLLYIHCIPFDSSFWAMIKCSICPKLIKCFASTGLSHQSCRSEGLDNAIIGLYVGPLNQIDAGRY